MQDFDDDDLHVDLTSLIDVIFMLVIFFIMTMSFTLPEIELNVPTSTTAEENDAASNSFSVKIDSTGAFLIDQKKLTIDELQKVIEQEKPQSITLYLDPDSPAQSFIDVSDLARTYTSGKLLVKALKRDAK